MKLFLFEAGFGFSRLTKIYFMDEFFVYIIQSEVDQTFYKGFTTDYIIRLEQHNLGKSRYTSNKIPWKLVYLEKCSDKTSALIREKSLKKANCNYIRWLLQQESNLLNNPDFLNKL
jgi:putative endonuclease